MDNVRGLLGFRRLDRVPIANIRELCGAVKGWIKVFFNCLVILKEWRMIGL